MNLKFKNVLSLIMVLALLVVPISVSCFAGICSSKEIALRVMEEFEKAATVDSSYKESNELRFPNDESRKKFIDLYNRLIRVYEFNQPEKNYDDKIYLYDLKAAYFAIIEEDSGLYNISADEEFLLSLETFNKTSIIIKLRFPDEACRKKFIEICRKVSDKVVITIFFDHDLRLLYNILRKLDSSTGVMPEDYSFIYAIGEFNGMDLSLNQKLLPKRIYGFSSKQ